MTFAFFCDNIFTMKNIRKVKKDINLIIRLVKNTNLRYKDVAETLKVDIGTVSRWVNWRHFPTRVYHDKIADVAKFGKKVKADKIL